MHFLLLLFITACTSPMAVQTPSTAARAEWCYLDLDADGVGTSRLIRSGDGDCKDTTEALVAGDCDDQNPTVFPGRNEIVGNGIDNDCDGIELCWDDYDGDTYGNTRWKPSQRGDCLGYREAQFPKDCVDTDPTIHPKAPEIPQDGIDQNCDGRD